MCSFFLLRRVFLYDHQRSLQNVFEENVSMRGGSPLKEGTVFHDLNRTIAETSVRVPPLHGGGNPQGIILYAAWQRLWLLSRIVCSI